MLPKEYIDRYHQATNRMLLFKPDSFESPWYKKALAEYEGMHSWVLMWEEWERRKANGSLEELASRIAVQLKGYKHY